jgi:DNA-damage-inducible protein J
MSQTATLQIKLDPQVKQAASDLFLSMGLTTADAVKLFLKQSLNSRSIPFEIKSAPAYFNDQEREEIAKAISDVKNGKSFSFDTQEEIETYFNNL